MNKILIKLGNVTNKNIQTPNQFVSHMVEHIAWRLGASINLRWENENFQKLGMEIGKAILEIAKPIKSESIALGMIDDGIAEVKMSLGNVKLNISGTKNVDTSYLLSTRCEQLKNGKPLIDLLNGLTEGLNANIEIRICNFEDPHHTWEGIFRGVGICLNKLFVQNQEITHTKLLQSATVRRNTAETQISIGIDFSKTKPNSYKFSTDKSVNIKGFDKLLNIFVKEAGCTMQVNFNSKVLSSSHVVMEDTGFVLGKCLLEILKLRFDKTGANGAGSSLKKINDFDDQEITVGLSVEGRKFVRLISLNKATEEISKKLIIGKNIMKNLRGEDLDDFIDGFAGGLSASIAICIKKFGNPDKIWRQIFKNLGKAVRETFELNPNRKGVPAGVKATLD